MSSEWYEVVALGARYGFTALGVIIVIRALAWQIGDSRRRNQVLRNLPDAGYIGTLYVLEGESDVLDAGDSINIPAEGVLGSAMGCDVFVPHPSVSSRHMIFHLFPDGLHVRANRDEQLVIDGEILMPGDQAILRHGAVITIGSVLLQLRLFVGVTVTGDAMPQDVPPPAPVPAPEKVSKPRRKKPARTKKSRKQASPEEDHANTGASPEEDPWSTGQWGNPFLEDDDQYREDKQ